MATNRQGTQESDLPLGLARPALRALVGAGLTQLEQISKRSEDELKKLHGIGPNAIEQLRQALKVKGLSFVNKYEADAEGGN